MVITLILFNSTIAIYYNIFTCNTNLYIPLMIRTNDKLSPELSNVLINEESSCRQVPILLYISSLFYRT